MSPNQLEHNKAVLLFLDPRLRFTLRCQKGFPVRLVLESAKTIKPIAATNPIRGSCCGRGLGCGRGNIVE
jgi:hypothetical protein